MNTPPKQPSAWNHASALGRAAYSGVRGAADAAQSTLIKIRERPNVRAAQASAFEAASKLHAYAAEQTASVVKGLSGEGQLIAATTLRRGAAASGGDPSTSILEFDFIKGEFIASCLKSAGEKSFIVRGKTATELKTRYDAAAKGVKTQGGRRKTLRRRKSNRK